MAIGFTKGTGRIGHTLTTFAECLNATLAFASGSSSGPGLLSVGLITSSKTITSYVIEWHLESPTGDIVFKSGLNPAESVNALHPFVNEPVVSGDLYAVVKYIVLDGIKYSTYPNIGQHSPDLKICFSYIPIDGSNCGNGVGSGNYSHSFIYVNNLTFEIDAERTIKFDLNSDGTTRFLALEFVGFLVADRVTVDYIKVSDVNNPIVISNWIIGTQNNTTNYALNPKQFHYNNGYLKLVLKLTDIEYQIGDYLLIHIVPRIKDPTNVNTNWSLYLKCLSSFDDYVPPLGANVIDTSTINMSWNSTNCRYELSWENVAKYDAPSHFNNYLETNESNLIETYYDKANGIYKLYFDKLVTFDESTTSYGNCINLIGSMNIIKNGSLLTCIFTDQSDYDDFKASYDSIISNSNWTNYSADNTSALHYKYWNIMLIIAPVCGDTYTSKTARGNYNSVVTWNYGTKTFSIDMVNYSVNPFSSIPCDSRYGVVNSLINIINSHIVSADYNITTNVRYSTCFSMSYKRLSISEDTLVLNKHFDYRTYDEVMTPGFIPSGWRALNVATYGFFGFRKCFVTGFITDTTDPINNFRLYSRLIPDGINSTEGGTKVIYEKIDGIAYTDIFNSYANNLISSLGWTSFSVSELTTINYANNNNYTTSTNFVAAIVDDFSFSIPTNNIEYLCAYVHIHCSNTNANLTFRFRFSKDGGTSWSNYSNEITGYYTYGEINIILFHKDDFGITLSNEEINDSLFRVELSMKVDNASYRATLTYFELLVYLS